MGAFRRVAQRRRGARALLAVVGGVAGLSGARRHAIEIGTVAIERVGGVERRGRLRRQRLRIAGPEADDGERAAQDRFSQPGTRITEKYGATSSRLSFERHGDRVRRGAALDIDGARQPPGAGEHAANLFEMAAELHHHGGIGIQQAPLKLGLRQCRRQHDEHIVALRDRRAGQRPAAGHRGDAGHDLGPVARREAHMQMHVGAVEQRIALAENGDGAAGIEMARHGGGGVVVEVADGIAVGRLARRHLGRHRIKQRQLLDAGTQMLRDDPARIAGVAGLGEMRDDIGLGERARRLQASDSSGSPGPTPTPIRRPLAGSFTVLPSPAR